MRRILLVFLLAASTACYRYVPLPTAEPQPGADVRSRLTSEGAASVANVLGRNVRTFDAKVMGKENDVWQFALSRTNTTEENTIAWAGESVKVPRSAIASMELRVLDRKRTVRAAVIGVAGGVAVGLLAKAISGAVGGDQPGGGGNNATILVR